MKKIAKILLFIIFYFSVLSANAQSNLDSLWNVWKDDQKHDTIRLGAIQKFIWEGFLFSNPDTAFILAQQQLDFATKIGDKEWMSQGYNTQGVSCAIRRETDKAIEFMKKSAALFKELGYVKSLGASYNNIGNIYSNTGEFDLAIEYFDKSLQIRDSINDYYGIASCYNNMAIILRKRGQLLEAINTLSKCLEISEKIDDKELIASALVNIGDLYRMQGEYESCLENIKKAIIIDQSLNNKLSELRAITIMSLCFKDMKEYDKAEKLYYEVIELAKEVDDPVEEANAISNIVSLIIIKCKEGKFKNKDSILNVALELEKKSLEISKGLNHMPGIISSKGSLSILLFELGQANQSIKLGNESIELAKSYGELLNIKEVSYSLFQAYRSVNDYGNALENYIKYIEVKDSLRNEDAHKAIIKQQTKYEYEKQKAIDDKENESKIAIEKEKQKNQFIIIIISAISISIVLILLLIIYRRLRLTKEQKIIIEETNEELNQTNEELAAQRDEIEQQKNKVEEAHKEIKDSINYAKRIQEAILPPIIQIKKTIPNSFVFYRPKDVVAGDFYWQETYKGKAYIAAADCTGHGVPGAMVSVVCSNALSKALLEDGITDIGKILDKTRELVINRLAKSENIKDGMDISLACIDFDNMKLDWAGANNPLYLLRNREIEITKGDREAIGYTDNPTPFTKHTFNLQKGDTIYLLTDGYADQFGGENGKKLGYKKFRQKLIELSDLELDEQKTRLESYFDNWKATEEQVDDVCVFGVKI